MLLFCVTDAVTAITKANSSGAPFLAFAGAGGAGTSATGLLGGASLLTFNSFFLAGAYKSAMSCKSTAVWGHAVEPSCPGPAERLIFQEEGVRSTCLGWARHPPRCLDDSAYAVHRSHCSRGDLGDAKLTSTQASSPRSQRHPGYHTARRATG